jgi:hypothetical protein
MPKCSKPLSSLENNAAIRAAALVYGPRQAVYGHPYINFRRIAKGWAVLLGKKKVTVEQVALCNIWQKLARLVQTPGHPDSLDDIIGYILALELCHNYAAAKKKHNKKK